MASDSEEENYTHEYGVSGRHEPIYDERHSSYQRHSDPYKEHSLEERHHVPVHHQVIHEAPVHHERVYHEPVVHHVEAP